MDVMRFQAVCGRRLRDAADRGAEAVEAEAGSLGSYSPFMKVRVWTAFGGGLIQWHPSGLNRQALPQKCMLDTMAGRRISYHL